MRSSSPCARQSASWVSAVSSAQSPSASISPQSSPTGMNSPGGTQPQSAWRQRISASTPATRPLVISICG